MNHSAVLLEDVQIAALRGQHKTFQQATMDFCDLQRIDYKQAFHCSHGMKHCSVDGICQGEVLHEASTKHSETWPGLGGAFKRLMAVFRLHA